MACGLITQHVQLLKTAVDLNSFPKNISFSLLTLGPESLPWIAFLVPSVPNIPLNDLGALYLAYSELVGPIRPLHFSIAFSATSSIPVTTSLVMKPNKFVKNGFPLCSP
jgi:hypothetical protein